MGEREAAVGRIQEVPGHRIPDRHCISDVSCMKTACRVLQALGT